jgi:hypothetical protein
MSKKTEELTLDLSKLEIHIDTPPPLKPIIPIDLNISILPLEPELLLAPQPTAHQNGQLIEQLSRQMAGMLPENIGDQPLKLNLKKESDIGWPRRNLVALIMQHGPHPSMSDHSPSDPYSE